MYTACIRINPIHLLDDTSPIRKCALCPPPPRPIGDLVLPVAMRVSYVLITDKAYLLHCLTIYRSRADMGQLVP